MLLGYYCTLSLILLRCQFAHASFGIPPQLSGGELVRQSSGVIVSAGTSLASVHASIQLDGRFSQAALALTAVYVPIASQTITIGDALLRLANDNGSIQPEILFGDVNAKILTLQTFATSTANPSLLATVQATVGPVVRNELSNLLVRMNSTLTNLRNALTGLRTGVINARTNATIAGGVYTTANLELNLPSSVILAVQTAANGFRTALAAVQATAQKSSQSIRKANAFAAIGQALGNGNALVEQLWEAKLLLDYERIMSFHAELESLVNSQLPLVIDRLGAFAGDFTANVEPLTELYAQVSSVFAKITASGKVSVLNAYQTLVTTTVSDFRDLLERYLSLMEPAIYRLSEIVLQQDRYASACYDAYAPGIEQYLAEGGTLGTGCLNVEFGREKVLVEALLEVIYELKFSLEDGNAYLLTCLRLSQFDQQLALECLQEHNVFSEIIPCTTTNQYATLLQLLCKEVDSIRFRLWTCLSREVAQLQSRTSQMLQDIERCARNGPPPAATG